MNTAHGWGDIDRRQQQQNTELSGKAISDTKQHLQAITHLRGKKADRANGACDYGDNT